VKLVPFGLVYLTATVVPAPTPVSVPVVVIGLPLKRGELGHVCVIVVAAGAPLTGIVIGASPSASTATSSSPFVGLAPPNDAGIDTVPSSASALPTTSPLRSSARG
jgi:hypothetical protein